LADLARLQFTSMVDAYLNAFQARMVHAGRLSPYQRAQLFTGGLLDHIRIDIELHDPQDLQRAMHLARAYKRRNAAPLLALPAPPARPPRRANSGQAALPPTSGAQAPSLPSSSAPPPWPFKRLTLAKMVERRKQGLCYNCDEPYVQGHKCARLFYLEASHIDEEPEELAANAPTDAAAFDPDEPMISLAAIVGIRTEDTMQLYITIGNDQFVALLDSGSTHNFVRGDVACCVGL
jgi:hypothetical protein